MTEWKDRAQTILEIVRANGFDDPSWENLPGKLAIALTELDELVDFVRGSGEDPLEEELADFAIRLLHVLEGLGEGWHVRDFVQRPGDLEGLPFAPVEVVLWPIVSYVCKAIEYWRHNNRTDAVIALELTFAETLRAASRLGVDLGAEVDRKNEKNAARPRLHGKARSLG